MKITRIFIHLFILLSFTVNAFAQQRITGRIIDNQTKEALIGASVVLSNTTEGATTDLNGRFSFETSQNVDSLSISYIGYQSKKVKYSEGLNIFLNPSATQIEQIIVSASREEQERKNAPVWISILSSQVIDEAKATLIEQVINKVSGVYVVDLGNEQHSMNVRQPLSYKSLFLYLEGGIPICTTGVFNHHALIEINKASVRNMEVIKGPASSLYGSETIGGTVNFITHRPTIVAVTKVQLQTILAINEHILGFLTENLVQLEI